MKKLLIEAKTRPIIHLIIHLLWFVLVVFSEAEDSNETPSSEEDQDLVDYNPDLTIKQNVSSSRKSISQIIKDKKKQTQLTLQW